MSDKTVVELKVEAKLKKIKGFSKMNRSELCKVLGYENCGKRVSVKKTKQAKKSPKKVSHKQAKKTSPKKVSPKKNQAKKTSPKKTSPKKKNQAQMKTQKKPVKKMVDTKVYTFEP